MVVTTGDLIQLLQLIVLAFTAVVFIAQIIIRMYLTDRIEELIRESQREKDLEKFRTGIQAFFVSLGFFAVGGTMLSLSLLYSAVPEQISFLLDIFESNMWVFGGIVLMVVIIIAFHISGDLENPHTGITGVVHAAVLSGMVSMFLLFVFVTLWVASHGAEWVYFISTFSVAGAMGSMLMGALNIGEVMVGIVDDR